MPVIARLLVAFLVLIGAAQIADAAFFGPLTFKPSGSPPVNTVAPVISPTTGLVGTLITSTNGTWTGSPTFTYQWEYFDTSANIGGATSSSYTPVSGDIGHTLALLITGTNGFGNATAVSNVTSTVAAGGCASGPLDANAASPGAWTVAYSLRVARAAFASGGGNAVQLQRSSDSTTQNIGFSGCNPDVTSSASFCNTASLSAGTTTSARAAFPTGSVIHIFNQGPNAVFYAAGNGSVTATPSSTPLPVGNGAVITVGANVDLAAIIGNGYGINGAAGSATIQMTNCGASIVYDQTTNANNATQSTLAKQLGYFPSCGQGGYSCLVGCLTCGMNAPDSAVYKTATVENFMVGAFGADTTSANFNYLMLGYPTTTSSNASDLRWGLDNGGSADEFINVINANNNNNSEGFGQVWRSTLAQYDYSTGASTLRWNGGTQFMDTGAGTPTYPNAVGLYLMGDAAGGGTPGIFVEGLVASGIQTARNTISAAQVSYWSITSGVASSIALTNPLSDGWNWAQQQLGGFAPNPPGPGAITINGNAFNTETSWNPYSSWKATNGATTSGQLGDLFRFQITGLFDIWDGTFRSEVDGAGGGAQFNRGVDIWMSEAILVEPGTAYTASWNITGQWHNTNITTICCQSDINFQNEKFLFHTFNASGVDTVQYTSPTITRNTYYHIVEKLNVSTSGSADTFDVWADFTTPGTMVHVATATGAIYNPANTAAYYKFGLYRETGNSLPTQALRYGNMQVCSAGTDCTTKYGVTDLSALTTTPLANPAHLFLLKRDLDPASNDNTPVWLNKAA